LFTKLKLNLIT